VFVHVLYIWFEQLGWLLTQVMTMEDAKAQVEKFADGGVYIKPNVMVNKGLLGKAVFHARGSEVRTPVSANGLQQFNGVCTCCIRCLNSCCALVQVPLLVPDMTLTTLLLLGKAGTGTPFHRDPGCALNTAYAVGVEGVPEWVPDQPLCAWFAVPADQVETLVKYVKGLPGRNSLITWQPSVQDMEDMVGQVHGGVLLYQCAGQRVHMPTGWCHAVCNMQACVKVAWDMLDPERYADYMVAAHQVQGCFASAPDFLNVEREILGRVEERANRLLELSLL
jgi:hypothetical protein